MAAQSPIKLETFQINIFFFSEAGKEIRHKAASPANGSLDNYLDGV